MICSTGYDLVCDFSPVIREVVSARPGCIIFPCNAAHAPFAGACPILFLMFTSWLHVAFSPPCVIPPFAFDPSFLRQVRSEEHSAFSTQQSVEAATSAST